MQIDKKAIVSTVFVFNIQTMNRNHRYTYMYAFSIVLAIDFITIYRQGKGK